jgi:hypothetical protein
MLSDEDGANRSRKKFALRDLQPGFQRVPLDPDLTECEVFHFEHDPRLDPQFTIYQAKLKDLVIF